MNWVVDIKSKYRGSELIDMGHVTKCEYTKDSNSNFE